MEEEKIVRECIRMALGKGADKVRVTLDKSVMDLVGILDGKVDKVTRCLDRSLTINLFAGAHYGSFSTNNLDPEELDAFLDRALRMTKVMAEDKFRNLPARERICTSAIDGEELEMFDKSIQESRPEGRKAMALEASVQGRCALPEGVKLISEEGEYSEELDETLVMDSEGLYACHRETAFEYGVEVTVQDRHGNRYSSFWWESSPFLNNLDYKTVGQIACDKAASQIDPVEMDSFKGRMVLTPDCSYKLVNPLFGALSGSAIQQHNSFLDGKLGQKVFSEGLTIVDLPQRKGHGGCRLFDSEGVLTMDHTVIEKGVIKEYFLNTYMAGKMQMQPTVEDVTAPLLQAWPREGLTRDDLLGLCGEGILVTEFNGGNYDSATGDFSYGIEGFAFKDGRITHPIHEMLITGNYITLWNNFLAAGSDWRPCLTKSIPSLAFDNVDFNGE